MLYDAKLLDPIHHFLACETPQAWIDKASQPENLAIILCDHLLCELKAAQSAMLLLRRYAVDEQSSNTLLQWLQPFEDFAYKNIGNIDTLKGKNQLSKSLRGKKNTNYSQSLIDKMVLLIKEELHHFYQVLEIMSEKNIKYQSISAGRYAKGLLSHVSHHEPNALIDKLIIGAYIEARSCERFAKLAPHLETTLAKFYISLLRSEFRHYQDYLVLAQAISSENIQPRIQYFAHIEAELILTPDCDFKFHSGVPA